MAAPEKGIKILSDNRQAGHNYFLDDRYEAGIVLVGTEVKSLKVYLRKITMQKAAATANPTIATTLLPPGLIGATVRRKMAKPGRPNFPPLYPAIIPAKAPANNPAPKASLGFIGVSNRHKRLRSFRAAQFPYSVATNWCALSTHP